MFNLLLGINNVRHNYTLATTGLKRNVFKTFMTRDEANTYMFRLLDKYGLHIVETYDDKHDKTYCCNNSVRFYIQRF